MSRGEEITLVGAGLVGSLLAVMLARRGYQVRVLEKRPDQRTTDISAGRSINLALAERGIRALSQAGLMDQVHEQLVPMRGRMLHAQDGTLEFQPYGQRDHEVIYSVSRGGLNKLMMTAAESTGSVEIMFNVECSAIDFERRRINIRDTISGAESQLEFERLIGADGANSGVRDPLLKANGGRCSIDFLDHGYKELCIPAAADGSFQMEKEALHIWPRGGYMLIALPNLDGSYTVTLFLNNKTPVGEDPAVCPSFDSLADDHLLGEFFHHNFPDALELIPNLTAEFAENPTGPLGTVRCDKWNLGDRAMILGDAAHGIVPFHGQGMNAGFEDCRQLLQYLDDTQDDWGTAIERFAGERPLHADAIADMAIENYTIMRDSVRDPKFQLKKELGFALEREFPTRFIPRYSMVMFHNIPYAVAFERGKVQDRMLDQLTADASALSEVDMNAAADLVKTNLPKMETGYD